VSKPEPGTRWPGPLLESAVPVISGYVTIVVEVTYTISMCAYVCVYMPTYGALLTIVISTYIHLCSHLSCPSSRHFPRCPRGFTRSKPAGRRIAPRHAPFSWVGSRQGSPSFARILAGKSPYKSREYPINGCFNGINRGFNGINGGLNRGFVTLPGEFPI